MTASIRDIEQAVCQRFHLTVEQMRGPCRLRKIARPRQMAMYLCRELTQASLPQIGRHFQRDHTTVLHAQRKIAAMLAAGGRMPVYLDELRAILAQLTGQRRKPMEERAA
jgi:chromosomal replication initiator protein